MIITITTFLHLPYYVHKCILNNCHVWIIHFILKTNHVFKSFHHHPHNYHHRHPYQHHYPMTNLRRIHSNSPKKIPGLWEATWQWCRWYRHQRGEWISGIGIMEITALTILSMYIHIYMYVYIYIRMVKLYVYIYILCSLPRWDDRCCVVFDCVILNAGIRYIIMISSCFFLQLKLSKAEDF